jgi:hypothetical protein
VDPITLIVAALVAGAAAGLKDTASAAVKDAYSGLRSLIRSRFGHHDQALDEQLAAVDQKPDTDPAPLAEKLRSAGAGDDAELVQAARALLAKADPDGKWQRQIQNITISNSKGVVGSNTGTVTMNFGDSD